MTNPIETAVCILGPTASGKTKLAAHLAYELNGEIISADSRQVYQELTIGSGKDLNEYTVRNKAIPYHLINCISVKETYDMFHFQQDAFAALSDCITRQKLPIVCGGTGLYLDALIRAYALESVAEKPHLRAQLASKTLPELLDQLTMLNPSFAIHDIKTESQAIRAIEIASATPTKSRTKIPHLKFQCFGLEWDPDTLKQRILTRLNQRLNDGMINEVATLIQSGIPASRLTELGLEYKFITLYLDHHLTYEEMHQQLYIGICQFAKRQRTWFRRMEKLGVPIQWVPGKLPLSQQISSIKKALHV